MAEALKTTVPLSKPIEANGEPLAALTLREPTGADLADCGMPVKFDLVNGEAEMSISPREMTAMLSRLAAVPPSSIRLLSAADWTAAAYAVAPYFLPATPTPTSSGRSPIGWRNSTRCTPVSSSPTPFPHFCSTPRSQPGSCKRRTTMRPNVSWTASPLLDGLGVAPDREPYAADLAFFRSGAPDPIETACRLGRFFGCAPTEFLRAEPPIVAAIVANVMTLMDEERDAHD